MTPTDASDPVLRSLARLRPLSPDARRAERLRARCRARLERNRRSTRTDANGRVGGALASLVLGSVCALYLAGLVGATLRLNRLLP
jgi:hypothetical protein